MKRLTPLLAILLVAGFSCKKHPEDPVPVPYTTFAVDGAKKTLSHFSKFSKDFCSSSTFCCRFMASKDTSNPETIKFGIPGDPIVGHVYYSGLYRFSCYYINASGVRYDLTTSDSSLFSVVFTQWEGQGGWARGYFSGWMKSADNDSVLFDNGYFQNEIWTMGTD